VRDRVKLFNEQIRILLYVNINANYPVLQVRITVYDDGMTGKALPTGFNADVEGDLI
jgi:hypothetical protein